MGIVKVYRRVSKKTIHLLSKVNTIEEVYDILSKHSIVYDIDKTWEILHFLLTGSKDPNGSLLSKIIYPENCTIQFKDGEYDEAIKSQNKDKIQEIQYRFGLAINFLKPKEVSQILEKMKAINIEDRIKNCDVEEINSQYIYKRVWTMDKSDVEYIEIHYNGLIRFMEETEKNQEYLLVS